jgi:hypothetical protein
MHYFRCKYGQIIKCSYSVGLVVSILVFEYAQMECQSSSCFRKEAFPGRNLYCSMIHWDLEQKSSLSQFPRLPTLLFVRLIIVLIIGYFATQTNSRRHAVNAS